MNPEGFERSSEPAPAAAKPRSLHPGGKTGQSGAAAPPVRTETGPFMEILLSEQGFAPNNPWAEAMGSGFFA